MTSLKKEIKVRHFRVTIFGSARIKRDDPIYKQIFRLAKSIALKDMDLVTGGGPGLMDAASRGHYAGRKSNKTHTIGLKIALPREQSESFHLDVKKQFKHFSSRLDHFMQLSNCVVVASGGVGTLLEFFYTWQLMQVEHTCAIPVILLGDMWDGLLNWVKKFPMKRGFLKKEDLDHIFIAKNNSEAIKIITTAKQEFDKHGKKACTNIDIYKVI